MKRLPLAVGFTLVLALSAGDALAQMASARGKVLDDEGRPIAGAKVEFSKGGDSPGTRETKTDKKGEFAIVLQGSGPWRISVLKKGYVPYDSPRAYNLPIGDVGDLPPITLYSATDPLRAPFEAATAALQQGLQASRTGNAALATAKIEEAEAGFKKLLEAKPDMAGLHFNLGLIAFAKQRWVDSGEAFLRAAQLSDQAPAGEGGNVAVDAYSSAAYAYQNARQVAKSEEILHAATAAHPQDVRLQLQLAEMLFKEGRYDGAALEFKKLRELEPANPEPLYFLGMMAAQSQSAEAVKLLEKYLAARPTSPEHLQKAKETIAALKAR